MATSGARISADATDRSDRVAWRLLGAHGAIIVFSTVALTTFLAGPPPPWLSRGVNAVIATWAYRLSGPSYVVLGAIATFVHASGRIGQRRAAALFLAGYALSLASELIGTTTGWPFGPYSYTALLGYRIAGRVPFPIPLSWFFMLYAVIALCGRFLPASDSRRVVALWAAVGGIVLTAWDISMEPAMSFATTHWIWQCARSFLWNAVGELVRLVAHRGDHRRRLSDDRPPVGGAGAHLDVQVRPGDLRRQRHHAGRDLPSTRDVSRRRAGRRRDGDSARHGAAARAFTPERPRRRSSFAVAGAHMRIVVIGAGFGGLAAAIRLQALGHEVTIVEKRDTPGGRAYTFRQDGFTFDAGPTILTAPWMIDALFASAGRRRSDYVELVPLDPFYTVRFTDGSAFRYNADRDALLSQIRAWSPGDVEGYRRFAAHAEAIFDTAMPLIDQPFTHMRDMVRVVPDLARVGAHRSVASLVSDFIRDDRLRQVFSFHPLLVGGNPFRTTCVYALIHTLEQRWGVWFARGGTGALVSALAYVFAELGGELCLNVEVDEIEIDERSRRAVGVRSTNGRRFAADTVVSNGDAAATYLRLVAPRYRRRNSDARLNRARYSMSLFVLYFGTDCVYPDVGHHEILMGPRYRDLLEDVFTRKTLAGDFSLYLHRPTATDPSLAPPGCDAFYVLSPVPHLGGRVDWNTAAQDYRDAIVRHLEATRLPGLSRHIVTERRVDPRYFRDVLNSHLGSAFSLEPTLGQSAWMRPHNHSEDVANLYLVGAGTHPGAGIPGVFASGKIVADMIGAARPRRYTSATRIPVLTG